MVDWQPDVISGFERYSIALPEAVRYLGEPDEVELTASLVRPVDRVVSDVAVLYVHGWNDYFFQRHLADFWAEQEVAFHALDLRRYGRNYAEGLLFGFTTDLTEYYAELDAAVELIRQDHPTVMIMGHSTGGLISALYVADRPGAISALILNSPWLDLQGSQAFRTLGPLVVQSLGTLRPTTGLATVEGFGRRLTHVEHGGEWEYDLDLKTGPNATIRAGWLQAVLNGHQRVTRGLGIGCPVLVMASARSVFRRTWDEELRGADVVLDVRQISERAVRLGRTVSVVRIPEGLHDLVLSAPAVRAQVFFELGRWLSAYGPNGPTPPPTSDHDVPAAGSSWPDPVEPVSETVAPTTAG